MCIIAVWRGSSEEPFLTFSNYFFGKFFSFLFYEVQIAVKVFKFIGGGQTSQSRRPQQFNNSCSARSHADRKFSSSFKLPFELFGSRPRRDGLPAARLYNFGE